MRDAPERSSGSAPETADDGRPGADRRSLFALLVAGALAIAWAALVSTVLVPLALTRHLHVDEIQVAYNAALLGIHHLPESLNFHAPLIVPLSWLAAGHESTWPFLLEARALFFVLFVFDLILVAAFAPAVRGWPARAAALLGVTLIEPFWRHGFEIRHDVLLLAGSLGLFACAQLAARRPHRRWQLLTAGVLAAWIQLNSLKAILIWPPALLLVWLARSAPAGTDRTSSRGRSLLDLALGLVLGVASGVGLLATSGLADDYGRRLLELGSAAGESERFAAGGRLLSLLIELPHLTLLAAVAIVRLAGLVRRGRLRDEAASALTAAWFLLEVVVLHLNPVPFTYNFIHLLPFLYLLAVDGLAALCRAAPRLRPALVGGALLAAALLCRTSWRGDAIGRASGDPQRRHIEAVEALTAANDPVLDGAGLVATRRPPGVDWMLHSLMMPAYRRGETLSFRAQLERVPAPVLLTNYRWDWLDGEDREFVRSRYVSISPRLFVLGGHDRRPEGRLSIHCTGRYRVESPSGAELQVDGASLPAGGVLSLEAGLHGWSGGGIAWAWLGPTLAALPDPGPLLPNRDLFISD